MLAGRVTGEPAMGVLHDALHDSRVEHAELRGKSLHNKGSIATRSAREAGITDQRGPPGLARSIPHPVTPHNRKEAPPGHAATAPLPCWPRRANPDSITHPLGRHSPTQRPNVTALPRRTAVPDATSAPPNQTVPAGQWLPGCGHSPTANRSSADQVHAEFTVQQIRQGLPVLGRRFGRPQIRLGLLDTADDGSGCWSTIRSARRYAARSPRCLPTFRRTSSRQPNCSANSGRLMPGTSRHRPSTGSTRCHRRGFPARRTPRASTARSP